MLNIVKSKLWAGMNQERLDSLLFMSIEHKKYAQKLIIGK